MHAKSFQSCPTLCYPMCCILPGSTVHGIFQARIKNWSQLPCPRLRDPPGPGIEPESLMSLVLTGGGGCSLSVAQPEKPQLLNR